MSDTRYLRRNRITPIDGAPVPLVECGSIRNAVDYGSFQWLSWNNVSFANGLLSIPDAIAAKTGGRIPHGFLTLGSLVGYAFWSLLCSRSWLSGGASPR
jgi:hypothetical protein